MKADDVHAFVPVLLLHPHASTMSTCMADRQISRTTIDQQLSASLCTCGVFPASLYCQKSSKLSNGDLEDPLRVRVCLSLTYLGSLCRSPRPAAISKQGVDVTTATEQ